MSLSSRNKEIQVQKPAQSLDHFKSKVASADDVNAGILKPVLVGAGILVAVLLAWGGISSMRGRSVERHEAALADLIREVEGSPDAPAAAAEVEKKMREKLPALEALLRSAPSAERSVTEGLLASWKLALEGKGGIKPTESSDPWARIRLAQAKVALGQGAEAELLLQSLRKQATPQEAWSSLYWQTLMESHRLTGARDQAWKDIADYRERFKEQGEANQLEQLIKGI